MMGFIIHPLGACHACLSLGLNKIWEPRWGRWSSISILFAIWIIVKVIFMMTYLELAETDKLVSYPFLLGSQSGWPRGTNDI